MKWNFCCPTLFGLEGIVADELRFGAKLEDVRAENGRVYFSGDEKTLAWANLNLRCAERVLIVVGSFRAKTFDELFEGVRALAWEDWIGSTDAFPVKGYAIQSALHSVPDCQKIIKKAIVRRLGEAYGISWFEETGAQMQIQFALQKDQAEIYLDSTGASLHKRGYRPNANVAPLRETLAAAMVKVARWRGREPLLDPFCGSGTIVIEAAMLARNRAPGIMRGFAAEQWGLSEKTVWKDARAQALAAVRTEPIAPMAGYDIDPECVALSTQNAKMANVGDCITFAQADAAALDYATPGVLFANPPYGERMLDKKQAEALYQRVGHALRNSPMKQYIICSDTEFEHFFGRRADKKRKLYNGMIRCDLYMYFKHSGRAFAKTGQNEPR